MTPKNRWNDLYSRTLKLYQKGDYAEASKTARDALKEARKAFGDSHPKVADSLHSLALLCCFQNDYEAGEIYFQKALETYERFNQRRFAEEAKQESIQDDEELKRIAENIERREKE